MGLRDHLQRICQHTPPGSLVPVDYLRSLLDAEKEPAPTEATPSGRDYTVKEVAKMEGRRPSTVRNWIRRRELEAYLYRGKEHRVTPAALAAFRKKQRGGEGAPTPDNAAPTAADDLGSWRKVRRPHAA